MRTDIGSHGVDEIPSSASSRMKLKRSHEPSSGPELFGSKRQVVEIDDPRLDHSLVPRVLSGCLFDPANANTSELLGRYIYPLDGRRRIEQGRQYMDEHCNNVSSIGLPSAHNFHSSPFSLDTITEANLNQVSLFGSMPKSMAQLYGEGISRSFGTGLAYNSGQDSMLYSSQTRGSIDKVDGNFIRNSSNEGIPMGDIYDKGGATFERGVENSVFKGQSLQKPDCNIFSTGLSYNKGQENFMSLLSYGLVPQSLFTTESNAHKEKANVLSGGRFSYTGGGQDRADPNNDRISHQERSNTISLADNGKEPTMDSSLRGINSCENLRYAPATAKDPRRVEAEGNMSFEFRNAPYASPRIDTLLVPKSKDSKTDKKSQANTFPSNVKSLLSTGMFDGISVKYYSWSREKNLKGIIKGTGYLCGCSNCNLKKVLNAYEFEEHANCKTKHPNNHIYFENGKTIYGVVQELKNTPQEKLFDAIQNVTGSDINRKNFNNWKASYQVASLELQRIYGKDAVTFAP